MQYYALVNTASPATGFITVGEVLTEKQAEALGAEKIAELVRERVLAPCDGEKPAEEERPDEKENAETAEAGPAPAPDDEQDESGGEDEELPELEITDEIVKDQAEEAPAEKPKKGGRRKAE